MRRLFAKQAVVTPFENSNTNEEGSDYRQQPYEYAGSNEDVDWQHVRISQTSSNRQSEQHNSNVNPPHKPLQRGGKAAAYPVYEEVHSGSKEDVKRRGKSREAKRQNSVGHNRDAANRSNAKLRNSRSYYGDVQSDPAPAPDHLEYQMQDSNRNVYEQSRYDHSHASGYGPQSDHQQFEQVRYPEAMPNPHQVRREDTQQPQQQGKNFAVNRSSEIQRGLPAAQEMVDERYQSNRQHDAVPVERSQDRYVDRVDDTNESMPFREGKGKMKNWLIGLKEKRDNKKANDRHQAEFEERDSQDSLPRQDRNDEVTYNDSQPAITTSGRTSPTKKKPEIQAPAWLDWKGMAKGKEKGEEGLITQQIGWLCAQDEQYWEQDHLTPLLSAVSHSEAASKEAAKALKKEIKMGSDSAKYGSVKLMAILFLRTGDRFKLQMANKRFLEVIEDVYGDKRTSSRMRGRLLVVWSMLAHQSRQDADLQPITKMFNKIKPVDMPPDGTPLDEDNDIFHTQDEARTDAVLVTSQENLNDDRPASRPELPARAQITEPRDMMTSSFESDFGQLHSSQSEADHYAQFAAQHADDLQRLHEESNVARGNAQLLAETLIEDGLDAPLLPEFLEKTKLSHEFISQQIPWASAQAEQARSMRETMEGEGQTMTEEEKLLEDLLDAHEKITNAQSMVEEAQLRRQEEEEEAQILDRSMREMRMDRNALVTDPETGHVYHYDDAQGAHASASGSRSVSPSPLAAASGRNAVSASKNGLLAPPMQPSKSSQSVPDDTITQFTQLDLNRSATTNSAPTKAPSHSRGNSITNSGTLAGPRPMQTNSPLKTNTTLPMSGYDVRSNNDEADESLDITTPIVPSEKALGKRRAISIHESSPVDDHSPMNPLQSLSAASSNGPQNRSASQDGGREGVLLARPPPALPS
ncbi:uncharacterized protein FA14DRAFT_43617 [Meira miltonrushii]|uniref:VHS domain-containing protein n=1 Tax=Meira miltonrushii TaxID=1280837 RepID=A0A316VDJ4_9BASI|nr:uncharacterized protein FA14DRAFT_43617 [Meira miltonrushii]PWN35550.1 hypothetical protein FA14DRAFT_43617 [Meira miltonrushii]